MEEDGEALLELEEDLPLSNDFNVLRSQFSINSIMELIIMSN